MTVNDTGKQALRARLAAGKAVLGK